MRQLVRLDDPSAARALADALELRGIESMVRDDSEVWVLDSDQLSDAREFAATFDASTESRARGKAAEKIRKERAKFGRQPASTGVGWEQSLSVGWTTTVTVMAGIAGLLAVITRLGAQVPGILFFQDPSDPRVYHAPSLPFAEPWRFVSPLFLHFGLLHLVFNALWLNRLGSQTESNLGFARFLGFVFLCGACSNAAQYWVVGPSFGGLSGLNYALLGFVWMNARYRKRSGYSLTSGEAYLLMGWLVICTTGLVGPVANMAHAVGLICGLLLGIPSYVDYWRRYEVKIGFEKDSWEDLYIKGFRRFRRLWLDPYLPVWLLLVAVAVCVPDIKEYWGTPPVPHVESFPNFEDLGPE